MILNRQRDRLPDVHELLKEERVEKGKKEHAEKAGTTHQGLPFSIHPPVDLEKELTACSETATGSDSESRNIPRCVYRYLGALCLGKSWQKRYAYFLKATYIH